MNNENKESYEIKTKTLWFYIETIYIYIYTQTHREFNVFKFFSYEMPQEYGLHL